MDLAQRLADVVPPTNKGGRPKGSKSRPKTVEAFIRSALVEPPSPPALAPKVKRKVHPNSPWFGKTAEERSQLAKQLRSKVQDHSKFGRKPVVPNGWTRDAFEQERSKAAQDAKHALKLMEQEQLIAADDDTLARSSLPRLRSPKSLGSRTASLPKREGGQSVCLRCLSTS